MYVIFDVPMDSFGSLDCCIWLYAGQHETFVGRDQIATIVGIWGGRTLAQAIGHYCRVSIRFRF